MDLLIVHLSNGTIDQVNPRFRNIHIIYIYIKICIINITLAKIHSFINFSSKNGKAIPCLYFAPDFLQQEKAHLQSYPHFFILHNLSPIFENDHTVFT